MRPSACTRLYRRLEAVGLGLADSFLVRGIAGFFERSATRQNQEPDGFPPETISAASIFEIPCYSAARAVPFHQLGCKHTIDELSMFCVIGMGSCFFCCQME